MFQKFLRWEESKSVVLLTICFIISRVIFRLAGVVFYGEFVRRLWQSIDIELLKTSLLESLYYSHAQPPLFNLLTGIILKIFPDHYSLAFHVLFLMIGWFNVLLLYLTLRKFKIPVLISLLSAFVFMILPSVVLYENLYSYTYLNVFLLTVSIYLLLCFVERQKMSLWLLFCFALCALVLVRSFYHVAWLIVIEGIVLVFIQKSKWSFHKLIVVSIIPILLVFGWMIKNFLLFES